MGAAIGAGDRGRCALAIWTGGRPVMVVDQPSQRSRPNSRRSAGSMGDDDRAAQVSSVVELFNVPITAMAQGPSARGWRSPRDRWSSRDPDRDEDGGRPVRWFVHDVMLGPADAFAGSNAEEAKPTIATKP